MQSTSQLARTEYAANEADFPRNPVYLSMSAQTSSSSSRVDSYGAACVGKRIARLTVESTSGALIILGVNIELGAPSCRRLDSICCSAPSQRRSLNPPAGTSSATSSIMNWGASSPYVSMRGCCSIPSHFLPTGAAVPGSTRCLGCPTPRVANSVFFFTGEHLRRQIVLFRGGGFHHSLLLSRGSAS